MAASDSPTTVQLSQLGCLFFDVAPPRSFNFDKRNVAQNNSLLWRVKQFLPCLNWLVTCFWFQNMFWKNINCFRFWWKTYTKRCTSNYVISRVKWLSSPALCVWSGAFKFSGYDLENGSRWWKSRFSFCSSFVYFADLKTIYFAPCLCCICKFF